MIIIAIAWLYVALMLSLGAGSAIAAVLGFMAWGPLPLSIFWYIFGRKSRRLRRKPGEPPNTSS